MASPVLVCCKRFVVCFYRLMSFTLRELYLSGQKYFGEARQVWLVQNSLKAPQYKPGLRNWKRPEHWSFMVEESLKRSLYKTWTLSRCREFSSVRQPWVLQCLCKTGGEATVRAKIKLSCFRLLSLATLSEGTRAILELLRHYEPKTNDRASGGNTQLILFPEYLHLILQL
jgi:hypothetical protein